MRITLLLLACGLAACPGSKTPGDGGKTGPTCQAPSDCPGYDPGCVSGVCGSCTSNASCPSGQTCVLGSCECQSNAGCGGDAPVCVTSTQSCGCATNAQCPSGLVCDGVNYLSGYCVPKCASNSDCKTAFSPNCDTNTGLCVPCLSNAQCIAAGTGIFCTPGGCAECRTNLDCQGGDAGTATPICDGVCVQCLDAQDCGGGSSCNSSSKTCGSCAISSDCPFGQGCTVDSMCASLCIQGATTPGCAPCELDDDCPASAPTCGASKQCIPATGGGGGGPCGGNCIGTVCNPATNACVQCLQDSDCGAGAPRCDTGTNLCVACTSSADCPFDAPGCADGFCGACKTSSDCPNAMTCASNGLCQCNAVSDCGGDAPLCLPTLYCGCNSSSQCGSGQICDNVNYANGACVANCATGSGCDPNNSNPDCEEASSSIYYGLCLACLTDAECQSNVQGRYCVFSSCVNCRSNADCTGGLKCNGAGDCN